MIVTSFPNIPPGQRISFNEFTLDRADESLWKGSTKIPLRPKAFALLRCLIERPGCLVTKEELLSRLWPDCNVGEGALKHCISEIRNALCDPAETPCLIETAHRRGYRFIGDITRHKMASHFGDLQWHSGDC